MYYIPEGAHKYRIKETNRDFSNRKEDVYDSLDEADWL